MRATPTEPRQEHTSDTMTASNESPPIAADEKFGTEKTGDGSLHPTNSVVEGHTQLQEDRNGQFHRSFTPRQVHVRSTACLAQCVAYLLT